MSVAVTIELGAGGYQELPEEFDPTGEGLVYGLNLPYQVDRLDALARGLGVRPISDFFDDSGMLTPEERADAGLPPAVAKWAPAADGLQTIEALINALAKQGATEDDLWDLKVSQAILARAVGDRFRFVVT
jgi:hypothetical protein